MHQCIKISVLEESMEVKVMNVCAGNLFLMLGCFVLGFVYIYCIKIMVASKVSLHTYRVIVANMVLYMHTAFLNVQCA